jgi:hypothetical protein
VSKLDVLTIVKFVGGGSQRSDDDGETEAIFT